MHNLQQDHSIHNKVKDLQEITSEVKTVVQASKSNYALFSSSVIP